jgi:hypothetical protein
LDFLSINRDMLGAGKGKAEPIFATLGDAQEEAQGVPLSLIKDQLLRMLKSRSNVP